VRPTFLKLFSFRLSFSPSPFPSPLPFPFFPFPFHFPSPSLYLSFLFSFSFPFFSPSTILFSFLPFPLPLFLSLLPFFFPCPRPCIQYLRRHIPVTVQDRRMVTTDLLYWSAGDESNGFVTDNVYCLVKIIQKMKGLLLLYNLKLNCLIFFYRSKQLTDSIYTEIYCKLHVEMHWTDSVFIWTWACFSCLCQIVTDFQNNLSLSHTVDNLQ